MSFNVDTELNPREKREYEDLGTKTKRAKYRSLRLRGEAHSFALLIAGRAAPQGRVKWSKYPTRSWNR